MSESKTPMTDAETYDIGDEFSVDGPARVVDAAVARKLERDRADLLAALADCVSDAPSDREALAAIERGRALLAAIAKAVQPVSESKTPMTDALVSEYTDPEVYATADELADALELLTRKLERDRAELLAELRSVAVDLAEAQAEGDGDPYVIEVTLANIRAAIDRAVQS